ncbi:MULTISPECIES: hypothetical protein [Arsenicicoccus]|uniref:hypothetical protein n=1 Tax=Arsenicicoccus TaxID=267408 RepID=UPI00257C3C79|nr:MULTISPECIES: hypothetical protein [Arsenicicoccus]
MTHDEALAALRRQGRGRLLTWQVSLWCLLAVSFGVQAWGRLGADRSDGLGWSMVVLALGNTGIVLSQLPALRRRRRVVDEASALIECRVAPQRPLSGVRLVDPQGKEWDITSDQVYAPAGHQAWLTSLEPGRPAFVVVPGVAPQVAYLDRGPALAAIGHR